MSRAQKRPKMPQPPRKTSEAEAEQAYIKAHQGTKRSWFINHWVGLGAQQARDVVGLLGLPTMGPKLDALAYTREAFRWLWANRDTVRRAKFNDSELSPQDQKAMMDVRLKELQYLERCGDLISRRETERFLKLVAERLKNAGEIAQREFGRRGWEVFDDLLQDVDRAIMDWCTQLQGELEPAEEDNE